jgi:fatty-acyl-CoA synthase
MSAATLIDAMNGAARFGARGYTFVGADTDESHASFAEIVQQARSISGGLLERGLKRGDRVALLLSRPADFVVAFFGSIAAGLIPVPVAPDPRASDANRDGVVSAIVRKSGAVGAIADDDVWLPPDLARFAVGQLATHPPTTLEEAKPEAPAFLQFTSGSTTHPRGVVVTHAAIMANAKAIAEHALRVDPAIDLGVSWLPLHHDMGLIGFVVTPMVCGVPVVLLPTSRFLRRPEIWLGTVHRRRATITFAPTFAMALARKRARSDWDLSCLRVVGCGAEPIRAAVLRDFAATFRPMGLAPQALTPSYGLAEATLAVTFQPTGAGMRVDRVDPVRLANHVAEPSDDERAIEIVGCGRPLPGHDVAVTDTSGAPRPERRIGDVRVRGPSVAREYFQDPASTGATFHDGWLETGDLGYLADGELFICGRTKEILVVHGRNLHPEPIEQVAASVKGIRDGRVVAFARPGDRGEEVVVCAEVAGANDVSLRDEVAERIAQELGVPVADVVLLGPSVLPRTTSGKLQRGLARAAYLAGEYQARAIHRPVANMTEDGDVHG